VIEVEASHFRWKGVGRSSGVTPTWIGSVPNRSTRITRTTRIKAQCQKLDPLPRRGTELIQVRSEIGRCFDLGNQVEVGDSA
jgi:hypothetical protein